MLTFLKVMFVNGKPLAAWISLLMAVNMVVPLLLIGTLEGQVVLVAFIAGAMTQLAIFKKLGFVRLLGLGHVFWVPMIPWLWTRLESATTYGNFQYWLIAVILLDGVSVIIDATDVFRYVRGERTPHLGLEGGRKEKHA
jgi:hypothetical protein